MVKRRKSKLEKWLSFNQHKKRFGAKSVQDEVEQVDFNRLKKTLIAGNEVKYTYGADKNLETHIDALRDEFSGQSELLYYHAKLIVLIRREVNLKTNIQLFEQLWNSEAAFFIKKMNSRWLIAAADTFCDHSKDEENRAYAIACSCLINTIKLNETERFLQNAENLTDDKQRHQQLTQERIALYDGISAFAVGTDDSLRNMRWRIDSVASESHSYKILKELFNRLQEKETVYQRFRNRHTRNKTAWW